VASRDRHQPLLGGEDLARGEQVRAAVVYTEAPSARRSSAGSLMPSEGRAMLTDRPSRTSLTSRSTTWATWLVGTFAARTWRWASA